MAENGPKTVTQLLDAAQTGDSKAAAELLPLIYDELRKLARARLAHEAPGQTLQPTALVHEAYAKLVGQGDPGWQGREHFFGAAARAMRQILVDRARRKAAVKHGGGQERVELEDSDLVIEPPPLDLLALDEALAKLEARNPRQARLVELLYFAGLSAEETAEILGVTVRTIERDWRFVRTWLHRQLGDTSL